MREGEGREGRKGDDGMREGRRWDGRDDGRGRERKEVMT